jgi:hypothetical protein
MMPVGQPQSVQTSAILFGGLLVKWVAGHYLLPVAGYLALEEIACRIAPPRNPC